jgi:hypothetical protein
VDSNLKWDVSEEGERARKREEEEERTLGPGKRTTGRKSRQMVGNLRNFPWLNDLIMVHFIALFFETDYSPYPSNTIR